MLVARVLLAALIAVSTVLLPIGCTAAQSSASVVSLGMHASDNDNMPCCPPEHSKSPPVFCALQCGSIIVNETPALSWVPVYAVRAVATAHRGRPLVGQTVRPPTHPPRV